MYEKQNVPDNYVDESFLNEMKKNLYMRHYDYSTLVLSTSRITQQVNTIVLFVMCYVYLSESLLLAETLSTLCIVLTLLCYLITRETQFRVDMKAIIIYSVAAFALSPVLMSLTDTISTDTIYAMSTTLFLLHLITHEYQDLPSEISGVVSLNAVTFATICLASRLKSNMAAFSLILLSIFLFAVFPNVRRFVRIRFPFYIDCVLTLLLVVMAVLALVTQSLAMAILNFLAFLFVTFVCPFLLLKLQPLKNNIYGPWDEAVVQVGNVYASE